MWYKNGGLICVIVVSPEKKMSQQPYPMTADSLLWFSGSYNQPLFSPLYPLVCAILPWNCSYRQFLFPYFRYSFQRWKIICWVAWWHPAFLISRILPPRTPRNTAKSKDYWVAKKYVHLIAVISPKVLLSVRCLWLAVFLPMCRAVTARVALFLPDSERCTMNRVYRLIGPM